MNQQKPDPLYTSAGLPTPEVPAVRPSDREAERALAKQLYGEKTRHEATERVHDGLD